MRSLFELLRCPLALARGEEIPLGVDADGALALSTGAPVVHVGSIPCLLPDAASTLSGWIAGLERYDAGMAADVARIEQTLRAGGHLSATTARLEGMSQGLAAQREAVRALFADAGIAPRRGAATPAAALLALPEGYVQTLRDWAWGDETEENQLARDEVLAAAGDRPLGDTLILGAGSGRLAAELAAREPTATFVAIDINPMPFLVLARMLRGEALTLYEFPRNPREDGRMAVPWRLAPIDPPPTNLHLVFADGRSPPLASGAWDTVLAPWYLDQVELPIASSLDLVHNLLTSGGRLIHHGPLIARRSSSLAEPYALGELTELMDDKGFRVTGARTSRMPYLASPVSASGTTLDVYTVVAERSDGPLRAVSRPRWQTDLDAPVERWPALDTMKPADPLVAAVVKLVDGKRSVRAIARRMQKVVRRKAPPVDDTLEALRALHRLTRG